jgi:hypothetical protein
MRRGGRQSGAGNARISVGFFVTKLQTVMRLSSGRVRLSLEVNWASERFVVVRA